jgi:hypothetical protein
MRPDADEVVDLEFLRNVIGQFGDQSWTAMGERNQRLRELRLIQEARKIQNQFRAWKNDPPPLKEKAAKKPVLFTFGRKEKTKNIAQKAIKRPKKVFKTLAQKAPKAQFSHKK